MRITISLSKVRSRELEALGARSNCSVSMILKVMLILCAAGGYEEFKC